MTCVATAISARYPVGKTGNLAKGVRLLTQSSRGFVAITQVKNSAKLASIYEFGTQARHYYTRARGVKHSTGAMPAGNVFIPEAIRARRQMYSDLKSMVESHGMTVK